MSRLIGSLMLASGLLGTANLAMATTYFVDATTGSDLRTPFEAQDPSTPWKTIRRALGAALSGDTVKVNPGTYAEGIESRVDGAAGAPIVLQSTVVGPGGAVIQPPAGTPGFFISHNYHWIVGFTVVGATIGIRLGDHDGGGPVTGLLVQSNNVSNNSSNGIQVSRGLSTEIAFNVVHDNGANGISYSGDSSLIHDNVVHHNGQFGIYVKDGVDHVVYDNTSFANVQTDLQILGATLPTPALIYYVDCATGNDARTATEAKNPATPWKSIKTALAVADGGDTVMVLGGTVLAPRICAESGLQSRRAGSPSAPITIKAATPGAVIIDPPAGPGFLVSHDYHLIYGFVITATNGIQVQGGGALTGTVISNNRLLRNSQSGIKVSGAAGVTIMHNVIASNGKQGIVYDTSSRANIFDNLIHLNGSAGAWGIEISSGNGHRITNNTVWGHTAAGSGGIRVGTSADAPVYSTVVNNIVVNNRVGIKEPAGSGYAGIAKLEFNDVFGNTADYDLSPTGSAVGSTSLSQDPRFVSLDPANPNFLRLSRLASGQPVDSPCIDVGSTAADTLGLGSRTVFASKAPDVGRADLGYHWPLNLVVGVITDTSASVTTNSGPSNDSFTLSLRLVPGAGSDGIELGTSDAELSFGSVFYALPVSGFQ